MAVIHISAALVLADPAGACGFPCTSEVDDAMSEAMVV